MPKKTITIDDTVFNQRLKVLSNKLGRDEKDFIREQTGLLAKEVSRFTPPYASFPQLSNKKAVGTAKDIKAGKDAIAKDMFNIVTTRNSPTITWSKRAFKGGPVIFEKQVAAGVITDMGILRQWHKSNMKPNNRTKWLTAHERYWVAPVLLNKYLKSLYPEVGKAKATFYKAAMQLGAKVTAPANVKKNSMSASGRGTVSKGRGKVVGTITGRAGGLFHVLKHLPKLRANRLKMALKRGEILMKAAAKKAKFKVN